MPVPISGPITKTIGPTQSVRLIGASNSPARILCFHGGGGVAGQPDMLDSFAAVLTRTGKVRTVAAEYCVLETYPDATLQDMLDDADVALDWALEHVQHDGIWVLGASFGALLALNAVLKNPDRVAGLILLNPVTDTGPNGFSNRVVNAVHHDGDFPRSAYKNHPALHDLKCLIVHGVDDDVVPVQASRDFEALWPAGQCELVELKGATHGFFNRAPRDQETAALIHAFTKSDEQPLLNAKPRLKTPPRLPNGVRLLCCVGAQKAGTSWLFDQLSNSPHVKTGAVKEWHYFNALKQGDSADILTQRFDLLQNLAASLRPGFHKENEPALRKIRLLSDMLYPTTSQTGDHDSYITALTRDIGSASVVCDFTPAYSGLSAEDFCEIATLGDVRFLYILRDPVARMWSQIRMLKSRESTENLAARCIDHGRMICDTGHIQTIYRADYASTVAALDHSKQVVEFAFFEDLFTQGTIDKITSFIDVPPIRIDHATRVNEGLHVPLPDDLAHDMTIALVPQYRAMFDRFGPSVPTVWRDRYNTIAPNRQVRAS